MATLPHTATPGSNSGSLQASESPRTMPEPKSRRKTHVKSRSGCRRCKLRRVKCDEREPACGACRKRSELCVYESERVTFPPPALVSQSALPLDTARSRELTLVHHWTAITCDSLSNDENRHEMRVTIPQCALRHEYLLNALFAITAAHLAYLHPESAQQHVLMALQFHSTSLRSFRPTLATISAVESPALVYCSILLGMITLALRSVDVSATSSPIDTLCQVSNLWRGSGNIRDVAGLNADGIMSKSTNQTPRVSECQSPALKALPQREAFFNRLQEAATDHADDSEAKHYVHAVEALKPNIQWAEAGSPAGALRWVAAISPEMVSMIQKRESLAVGITLYFCSLLKGTEQHWWLGSFASDLLEELGRVISLHHPSFEAELEWVRKL